MTSPTPGTRLSSSRDEAIDVVADEQRVVLVVLGVDAAAASTKLFDDLGHRDADLLHLVRQPPFDLRDAVLHVDGGDVEVARRRRR